VTWRETRRNVEGLPADWERRRAQVFERDGFVCQLRFAGCRGAATEVDHVDGRGGHGLDNLQAVCLPCHQRKTENERREGLRRYWARGKRPQEKHPGDIE